MSAIPHEPGTRCLLLLMERRYMVTVLQVSLESFRVTFPTVDYPPPGTPVELEVHDDNGYTGYLTQVIEPQADQGDGLLLSKPDMVNRSDHRGFWRVPGEGITAELKSHVHPRRFDADVVDISAGGMLLRCRATLEMGENVDLLLRLPGYREQPLSAKVVHLPEGRGEGHNRVLVGLQFYNPDPVVVRVLSRFIWNRIRTHKRDEVAGI